MIQKHSEFPDVFADKIAPKELDGDHEYEIDDMVRSYTDGRTVELYKCPIAGNFDLEHYAAIHGYLFQDVSSVAGSVRNYCMEGYGKEFATPAEIDIVFSGSFSLSIERLLNCKGIDDFAEQGAYILAQINYAHPCRDGNGRTTRIFMEYLANKKGYSFNLENVATHEKGRWYFANAEADRGNMEPLVSILKEQITTKEISHTLSLFTEYLIRNGTKEEKFNFAYKDLKMKLRQADSKAVEQFKDSILYALGKKTNHKNEELES